MAINYAKQYTDFVDEVYKQASLTRFLETPSTQYKPVNGNTILINSITVTGCKTYSRTTGYPAGTVANTWADYTLDMERGIKVPIDVMDMEEARIEGGRIANTWLRESFFPELDLYRFTKIYTDFVAAGGSAVDADLTYDTAIDAIDTGIKTMNDNEVPKEGRLVFVSPNYMKLLKQSGEWYYNRTVQQNNGIVNRNITVFDDMPIIEVPSGRFNSAATFGEGTNTLTGKAINFMIVHQPSVIAVIKHSSLKIIPTEVNGDSDGIIVATREYHGCSLLDNKALKGVYIHRAA
jgi:hypothetical protein